MVDVGQDLVVGVGMDGGHQPLLDAELAVQHLGDGRQAVGGAGRIGNDLVRGAQNIVVDPIHHRGVRTLGRCRNNHLASARRQMGSGLGAFGEQPGAFEHHIDRLGFPRQLGRIADGTDRDPVAIDDQAFMIGLDSGRERAVHAVVLEQVSVHGAVAKVVDGDDLQVLAVALGIQCAKDIAPDAAESIDGDAKGHEITSGGSSGACGTKAIH
ncbi:hypothetical protein D3C81_985640 [compost metagenome]